MNLAILTISVVFLAVQHSGGQLVNTNSGQLLGRTEYSRGGQAYYSFKAIPYAEKPDRFQVSTKSITAAAPEYFGNYYIVMLSWPNLRNRGMVQEMPETLDRSVSNHCLVGAKIVCI